MFEAERIAGTDFEPNVLIEFIRPPFRKYQFSTRMSTVRAADVLQEIVEPRKTFKWRIPSDHRYFEGSVGDDQFKINRIIEGRDSFLPMIEGTFRAEDSGALVTLNLRMAWPVMIFCFIAFTSLGAVRGKRGTIGVCALRVFHGEHLFRD